MPKKFNLKNILKKNPHIKEEDVSRNASLAEELRRTGLRPHGYQLLSPHERHLVKTGEEEFDHRTVNLSAVR